MTELITHVGSIKPAWLAVTPCESTWSLLVILESTSSSLISVNCIRFKIPIKISSVSAKHLIIPLKAVFIQKISVSADLISKRILLCSWHVIVPVPSKLALVAAKIVITSGSV